MYDVKSVHPKDGQMPDEGLREAAASPGWEKFKTHLDNATH